MTVTALIPAQREAADRWEIVTRAQAGDTQAFGDLYRLYEPVVRRFINARTQGNRDLAEDLTQDVFVRAIKSLHSVQWQGRDIGAWLVTIARNIVWDHFKSGRTRYEAAVIGAEAEHGWHLTDTDRRCDPEQVAVFNGTSTALDAALAQLTADQRQVLALRYGAGLSVAETAAAMGKEEGAIKAATYRATQTMARLLRLAGEAPC
ncbi:MAG TPA: sigma-70 family RNA polymerase sigma factor [Pseudonocardia sp.]